MDYLRPDSREDTLTNRGMLNTTIDKFLTSRGYSRSPKTKTPHSLDSWVYEYINAGGNRDNIKLEINYSLRAHVLPAEERPIITEHFSSEYRVKTLAAIEIFGSKINAMLSRAAARDLYDVGNMVKYGLFDESERDMLRKCVVFYAAISAKKINKTFDSSVIDVLDHRKIKTDLLPVIRRRDKFDLEATKKAVRAFIEELMTLTESEVEFLERFERKEYCPELLFQQEEILARISKHPMALWKTK